MALHSPRLGDRGLTIMHFRPLSEMKQLLRSSTNANRAELWGWVGAIGYDAIVRDLWRSSSNNQRPFLFRRHAFL